MRISAIGRRPRRLIRLTLLPAAVLLLAACSEQSNTNPTGDSAAPNLFGETSNGIGFPHEVVTSQGIESAGLYLPIFLVAVAIFILVEGLLLYMSLRFRRRGSDGELPPQTHGHNTLEIVWTAVPALIVTIMFIGSTVVLTNAYSLSDDPDVSVDVQAFRFGWKFDYPDSGISIAGGGREGAPEMVLPVNEKVRFRVTAADVIHSFYVPSFFFKRDAIPGRTNEFELTIEKPGIYGGQCAEFCGLAHSDMFFSVRAVEPAEFDAWVAEQTSSQPPPREEPPREEPPREEPPREGSAGAVLEISSTAEKPIAFTTSTLEAQAGAETTLRYTNDSNVPHNVEIFSGPDAGSPELAETETVTGPGAHTEITFTAPETPGDYFFRCGIHPLQMTGTLIVSA